MIYVVYNINKQQKYIIEELFENSVVICLVKLESFQALKK